MRFKLIFLMLCLHLVISCTSATIITKDGTTIEYMDFHPTGSAVTIYADWEGIGSLRTSRESEGVEEIIKETTTL